MNLSVPKGWRKGQTIFNFLHWLYYAKGYQPELEGSRMADPFHISDSQLEIFYQEFLNHILEKNQYE